MKRVLIAVVIGFVSLSVNASNPLTKRSVLSADQAYTFLYAIKDNQLHLRWQIAPGYHMYKHSIKLSGNVAIKMPDGKLASDAYYGNVELYSGVVDIPADISKVKSKSIFVYYQGCKLNVICYPPQRKEIFMPFR